MPEDLSALAADVKAKSLFGSNPDTLPLWITHRLAGLLEANLPREPVLADFEAKPEAKAAAPAAEKPKMKKAGRKIKRKYPSCDRRCDLCASGCESRDDEAAEEIGRKALASPPPRRPDRE